MVGAVRPANAARAHCTLSPLHRVAGRQSGSCMKKTYHLFIRNPHPVRADGTDASCCHQARISCSACAKAALGAWLGSPRGPCSLSLPAPHPHAIAAVLQVANHFADRIQTHPYRRHTPCPSCLSRLTPRTGELNQSTRRPVPSWSSLRILLGTLASNIEGQNHPSVTSLCRFKISQAIATSIVLSVPLTVATRKRKAWPDGKDRSFKACLSLHGHLNGTFRDISLPLVSPLVLPSPPDLSATHIPPLLFVITPLLVLLAILLHTQIRCLQGSPSQVYATAKDAAQPYRTITLVTRRIAARHHHMHLVDSLLDHCWASPL